MTNPIAVNMSDRIWNEMQDIIKDVGWAALGEAYRMILYTCLFSFSPQFL
jgi:hypothetical protein